MHYFAHAFSPDYIKIGYASPEQANEWKALRRVKQWMPGCPYDTAIIGVVDGSSRADANLRRELAAYQIRGKELSEGRIRAGGDWFYFKGYCLVKVVTMILSDGLYFNEEWLDYRLRSELKRTQLTTDVLDALTYLYHCQDFQLPHNMYIGEKGIIQLKA